MKRALLLASFVLSACSHEPRALVLVDAAKADDAPKVKELAQAFEAAKKRSVTVLHVPSGEDAKKLAARGEAEVALIPADVALDEFVARNDGSALGTIDVGGSKLRIVEVNAAAHPKIDGAGARDLAEFLKR